MQQPSSQYQVCIDACLACTQACEFCASSCLTEPDVKAMVECIRLDDDCADICLLTARMLMRNSRFNAEICHHCAELCQACAAECSKHKHDHCQRCAAACRRCAEECRKLALVAAA